VPEGRICSRCSASSSIVGIWVSRSDLPGWDQEQQVDRVFQRCWDQWSRNPPSCCDARNRIQVGRSKHRFCSKDD